MRWSVLAPTAGIKAGGGVFGGGEDLQKVRGDFVRLIEEQGDVNAQSSRHGNQRQGRGGDGEGLESSFKQFDLADAVQIQLSRVVHACALQSGGHVPVGCDRSNRCEQGRAASRSTSARSHDARCANRDALDVAEQEVGEGGMGGNQIDAPRGRQGEGSQCT